MEAAALDDAEADAALLNVIGPAPKRLDEAISPVAGRRFIRA